MKKIYFYIIVLTLILLLLIGIYYYFSLKNKGSISDQITPTPTIENINQNQEIELPMSEENIAQIESDMIAGIWTQELYDSYPWYDKLPFGTNNYFIYFDIYAKKFIVALYSHDEPDLIKQEIFANLNNIGVDYTQYEFEWRPE